MFHLSYSQFGPSLIHDKSNTMGAINRAETPYPLGANAFTPLFTQWNSLNLWWCV
jgi:hypothetical protein